MNSSFGSPSVNSSSTPPEPEAMLAPKLQNSSHVGSAVPSDSGSSIARSTLPATCPLVERMSINQLTTLRNCLTTDLAEYRRFGVPAIGLSWRKIVRYGVRRSLRRVQESGLPVSSVGWIGGFTGEHGHSLEDLVSEARKIIRFAGQARASTVTVVTGPQGGHIRSHAFRIITEALKELGDLAGTYGITLALQPMHSMFSKNWTFLNSIDDSLQLLDRVNLPQLQLAFGAYHLWEEADLLKRIEEIAPRVGLVTLADWGPAPIHENDRLIPGEGNLPLSDMILALENHGFTGWYELEVWSRDLWNLEHRDLMRRCIAARDHLSSLIANG